MTPREAVLLVMIVFAFAASRCYLVLRYRWVGSDAYYHFVVADLVRAQGTTQPHNDRFLRPEQVDYPPLVPWLVAQLPPQWRCALQYLSPACDAVTLAAVTAAAWGQWGPAAGLVAAAVYTTTPAAFDLGYAFSPRALAHMCLTLMLLALLWGLTPALKELLVIAGLGTAVLLTHRLTAQSLLVALLAYAPFAPLSAASLVLLIIGMALALTQGGYWVCARGHVAFLQAMHPKLSARAVLQALRRVSLGNPHLLTLGVVVVAGGVDARNQSLALACVGALLVLAVGWPWGEGDRHFANAAPLLALSLGGASLSHYTAALLLASITVGAAIIVAKNLLYPRLAGAGAGTIVTEAVRAACAYLRSYSHNGTEPLALVWPQSLSYQVMYFGAVRVVLGSGGNGAGLAYNRDLRARVAHAGLAGLHADEQPALLVVLDRAYLAIPPHEWQLAFAQAGVSIYCRLNSNND